MFLPSEGRKSNVICSKRTAYISNEYHLFLHFVLWLLICLLFWNVKAPAYYMITSLWSADYGGVFLFLFYLGKQDCYIYCTCLLCFHFVAKVRTFTGVLLLSFVFLHSICFPSYSKLWLTLGNWPSFITFVILLTRCPGRPKIGLLDHFLRTPNLDWRDKSMVENDQSAL